jgi:hypothetical protein
VKYSDNMKVLAQRLLCIISESLNLPPSYLQEAVGEAYQNITISYYSPCPQPDLALGLQSHSDFGAITLLIQDDVGGLEVLKDDMWIPVPALPDAILVILSDQTEVITFTCLMRLLLCCMPSKICITYMITISCSIQDDFNSIFLFMLQLLYRSILTSLYE